MGSLEKRQHYCDECGKAYPVEELHAYRWEAGRDKYYPGETVFVCTRCIRRGVLDCGGLYPAERGLDN